MPGLQAAFIEVVAPHTAGSPMDENVRWTRLTRLDIAEELAERDFPVGLRVVAELLQTQGYVKRQAEKSLAMGQSPHRNEQFENIARLTARFQRAGLPVISMDTKKKELLGNFYRAGRLYTTAPIRTFDHDFRTAATGLVIPHGLYDVVRNVGHITLGVSHDTSAFACDSLAAWWRHWGRRAYPDADSLLLLCDCGGSNSATQYLFKADLERLAERLKLTIRVAHYPPYTSKYNPIEHRFFPHVTRACQGVVFDSLETVRDLMAETHTLSGLTTTVAVLKKDYPTKRRVQADYKRTINIQFDKRLSKWNYQAQWNY